MAAVIEVVKLELTGNVYLGTLGTVPPYKVIAASQSSRQVKRALGLTPPPQRSFQPRRSALPLCDERSIASSLRGL